MSEPLVTVGLPVYNEERYVSEAIGGILGQSMDDLELVVADNGSEDATADIVRELAAKDRRVRYLASPVNRGAAWNYNRIVPMARGRYFRWSAADDVLEPGYLAETVRVLRADPTAVLCHSWTVDIDEEGRKLGRLEYPWDGDARSAVARFRSALLDAHPCVDTFGLMPVEVIRAVGRAGGPYGNYYNADRVMLADLALRGPLRQVPAPLFRHREHGGRSVHRFPHRYLADTWWDTDRTTRVTFPTWRYGAEVGALLRRVPMSSASRWRCATVLGR
ncbi:MAG: glycosyltransferase family 2 protein, partial [Acidimicrobiales bacterium]